MKKLILTLVLLFCSCTVTNTYLLHEKFYSIGEAEKIKYDIYENIRIIRADSIPLKDWKYMGYSSDTENQGRRIYSYFNNPDEEVVFVLTTHETKDSTYYSFKIYLRETVKK